MIKNYLLLLALCLFSSVNAQIINFPDPNFKMWLLTASGTPTNVSQAFDVNGNQFFIDSNHDGEIQVDEAKKIYKISVPCSSCYDDRKISSIEGIQYFINLTELNLSSNLIENVDLKNLKNLVHLSFLYNKLKEFDFTGLENLETFEGSGNLFETIDFSKAKKVRSISCGHNNLNSINVSNLSYLQVFYVENNNLSSLNISDQSNLVFFYCNNNKITNLDTKSLYNIVDFRCENNLITSLDFSNSKKLETLNCNKNKLSSLFLKNGHFENNLQFNDNPDLKFICADENFSNNLPEMSNVNYMINEYKLNECSANSYCSFNPGGIYYTINGNQKYDSDNNGCDISDTKLPNLNFDITNGVLKGNIISDESGNYSIPVGEGTHTITPILENPNYYEVSPESFVATFPTQTSQFTQNFCVTPKGEHQDVEITILSLLPARPGFDANYKIVYKNKGNKTVSGSVTLDFNDAVLDYVSAVPNITSQTTNKLVWDYTNLKALETREINVTLNVNSPMETPAVNINDRLSFNALITPVTGDEKPVDNSFALRQTVVGSYDPNDKTCLEGDVITPELIGEYVHYLIRFENTGTYPAENIVVKDMIDLSKFDISTLVPTSASHSYTTKISEGNKVEFIFEKINLPFNDANNDGYIAFKIKTLPTLSTGDSFTNEANIYFDYNFPILTNKATSTFKTLGTQDFEFSKYFTIYPNPVQNVLNISIKNDITIKSIAIYDVLGQLVIVVPNSENVYQVDVSKLKTGNYFIKIKSNKGTSSSKFIKV
ncbi:putative repeat protein (TIGR01451 family)/predicted secreted protein (Por secretion system target) [Flavobacterium chryseum]|uniref:T9SS type A sorting domain-containing protein n=1 Tax=Flavobacterium sp. P3160 TaxID=2512113 RepID=UPI00105B6F96|nr:T9SS type A sorting domain-containing protein [Flavobacterium sp. P3160]TDO82935.1 putative repeat protein (TIGR01451 family)/predicted secreted protein (Por secretion system target) [Flavobacterium sp. P3160]